MFRRATLGFLLAVTLAACATSSPLEAQGSRAQSGPRAFIEAELPYYGIRDVDVDRLSTSQVVQIYTLMNSPRSQGDKARLIRSALGRGLRGALFGGGL
jgi:hypothetical protein